MALQGDDVDVRGLQLREGLFVLAPLRAERLFPVGIGLDAVAVADVDRGFALKPFNGALQRGDAPVIDLIKKDVKRRFIELDNVHACGL